MTVRELIKGIRGLDILKQGNQDREIGKISFDSRNVAEGDVFVALKGTNVDGHDYLEAVAKRDPALVVVEKCRDSEIFSKNCTVIATPDTHLTLGLIASAYYGNPSSKMVVIGVTGTNGKTTIATLLHEMALKMGVKSGLLSTIANYVGTERMPATHTTPDSVTINRLMAEMYEAGCRFVAMEVSSHAAHQKRIAGIDFKGAVFTNLTRDHLDYHKTVSAYRDAKKMFFDSLSTDSFALVNADDANGNFMLQNCKAARYTYALNSNADFKASIIEKRIDGTLISINGNEIETLFSGTYNIYNLTAVYGALLLAGFDKEETLVTLSGMKPVAGRFQTLRSDRGVTAVVDYAHTPDALQNILKAINEIRPKDAKVITVTGAGGDRDKGKRPQMGEIASKLSHTVILTADNPRSEDPMQIIEQMLEGVHESNRDALLVIPDRRQAIKTAIMLCGSGDIVLVAGKGHEDYQEIAGVKHHFSDVEEIKKIFENN